jgi:hypothetical protein
VHDDVVLVDAAAVSAIPVPALVPTPGDKLVVALNLSVQKLHVTFISACCAIPSTNFRNNYRLRVRGLSGINA